MISVIIVSGMKKSAKLKEFMNLWKLENYGMRVLVPHFWSVKMAT